MMEMSLSPQHAVSRYLIVDRIDEILGDRVDGGALRILIQLGVIGLIEVFETGPVVMRDL
jgi:hypothetical protein